MLTAEGKVALFTPQLFIDFLPAVVADARAHTIIHKPNYLLVPNPLIYMLNKTKYIRS